MTSKVDLMSEACGMLGRDCPSQISPLKAVGPSGAIRSEMVMFPIGPLHHILLLTEDPPHMS
jgi:hypothetical protein